MPKIETKTEFKTGLVGPLLCDVDLIKPDGELSANDKAPGVVLAAKVLADGNLYREENIFGFGTSNKYPAGRYVVRLKIYNSEKWTGATWNGKSYPL